MFLGNSLESFDPEPGKPRSIAPGKQGVRDIPTVLMFKDDEPFAGLSGSGGWRIIGGLMHLMLNLVDFGMGIQEAIEHPRLHCDDGNLYVDQRVGPTVLAELSSMGHQVAAVEENVFQSHFCRPVGVVVDAVSGKLHGGADPLRSAAVAGY
jgi:gamma-glutamyltranspeptidase/glutathione hydrolase